MIALICALLVIGVFLAGHYFAISTVGAMILLSVCVIGLGAIFAALELHAIEGQRVQDMPLPWTWEKLWLNVVRLSIDRETVAGAEPIYALTGVGPVPITGVFTARLNGVVSLVLDTTNPEPVDHAETFNALKQGVM